MDKRALIISGVGWNSPWQRHHIVARNLVDSGYCVDFLENVTSGSITISKLTAKIRSALKRSTYDSTAANESKEINVIRFFNFPPGNFLFNSLSNFSLRASRILHDEYDLIVCYIPRKVVINLVQRVRYRRLVYDCVRDFHNWGGYSRDVLEAEKTLMRISDEVWCDSFWLKNKIENMYGITPLQILPTSPLSPKLVQEANFYCGPIRKISYFGSLDSHVDLTVLEELHSYGIQINFAGVASVRIPHFIRDHGYIAAQDILFDWITKNSDLVIIPYIGNMDGVIPSKLTLAVGTGKPVLCSDFFDSRKLSADERLKDTLFLYRKGDNLRDVLRRIEDACRDHTTRAARCRTFIEQNNESVFKKYI